MTLRRLIVSIAVLVAVSIVNVYHHALVVQRGYAIAAAQAKNARMQRSIAALESKVLVLASPARLRAKNDQMQLGLVSPSKWQEAPTAVAVAHLGSLEQSVTQR